MCIYICIISDRQMASFGQITWEVPFTLSIRILSSILGEGFVKNKVGMPSQLMSGQSSE